MLRHLAVSVSIAFAVLIAAAPAFAQQLRGDRELKLLAKWMTGDWDTFAQVDEDEESDAPYRHTRALLRVVAVTVTGLGDGIALYVENQQADSRSKPYRQRVYFLTRIDGAITMQIFRIGNAEEFVNAYKKPKVLRTLDSTRLTREAGCDLKYVRDGGVFRGKVENAKTCPSKLRGATYTYSESEIGPDRWVNLDQGFDDAGNHKWGPPPGTVGHVFRRRR
ncbi:MAG TPA: chromophore lyase CpcT/CpeT [Pyrinomonadaceae bacterium]|nr:chromophore lyase CpcT/CpeT [Pyrinomonadaceae bacterium]